MNKYIKKNRKTTYYQNYSVQFLNLECNILYTISMFYKMIANYSVIGFIRRNKHEKYLEES